MTQKEKDPARKMIASKKKLIARLHQDIKEVNDNAAGAVLHIRSRIRLAQAILDALQKGTLKP